MSNSTSRPFTYFDPIDVPNPDPRRRTIASPQELQELQDELEQLTELNGDMTIQNRQETINKTHPFGMRIWKPALYKKDRSIERKTYLALHSTPSSEFFLNTGNVLWLLCFGWWLCLLFIVVALVHVVLTFASGKRYAGVLLNMSWFLLWPFGKYVELYHPELEEHDREISWIPNYSAVAYYSLVSLLIAPLTLIISFICWMFVATVPMSKLTFCVLQHLYADPMLITAKHGSSLISPNSEILLCTKQAMGMDFFKYTIDGVNIVFINLLVVVVYSLVGVYVIPSNKIVIFCMQLLSSVPLAYFIGMAVSSISAQSSLGVGAVLNATFGSIVELILYAVALRDGKGELVEGSIIGSILGALLLLPGLSMIAGSFKLKDQRFNAKSAGVTSTLLIMSIIAVFAPTIFQNIYGKFSMQCDICAEDRISCQGCVYTLPHPSIDPIYLNYTRPFMYICAAVLPSAYLIGLWFMLRTHVKQIYNHGGRSSASFTRDRQFVDVHVDVDPSLSAPASPTEPHDPHAEHDQHGHDSPNWSNKKSTVILIVCTVLFSWIAELLVHSVDDITRGRNIDEKFLGLTLFAIVPNVTEFMNAISFATYGNIALSLEIGSAYVVQVAMLQIPVLVAYSALSKSEALTSSTVPLHSFTLIFPRWDFICVFFTIFLISYVYIEGKSNYFKGSILTFAYLVFAASFYFVPK